jgi:gluconokinase
MIVVLMGVSGSGKTTIGTLLAQRTGTIFADADDYHPQANKDKMRAGIPLNDEDREPWLKILNGLLRGWYQSGEGGVLACSALKEKYRQTLVSGIPPNAISFVWLDGDKELLAERLAARHHSYMNPKLLDSQIATLEPPKDALRVNIDHPPDQIVREILEHVSLTQDGTGTGKTKADSPRE